MRSALAQAFAAIGEQDRAVRLAESIGYPFFRAQALAGIASFCDPARAEEIADTITQATFYSRALTKLSQGRDVSRARQLIVDVLSVEGWEIPLPAIARIDPGAVIAMATSLLPGGSAEDLTNDQDIARSADASPGGRPIRMATPAVMPMGGR